jgi:hypothetical protein
MKQKPMTPYQRLLEAARKYARDVDFPKRARMWTYPKDKLNDRWTLGDLKERAAAAEQLGFDVRLKCTDEGLEVWYVQKRPERPGEFS